MVRNSYKISENETFNTFLVSAKWFRTVGSADRQTESGPESGGNFAISKLDSENTNNKYCSGQNCLNLAEVHYLERRNITSLEGPIQKPNFFCPKTHFCWKCNTSNINAAGLSLQNRRIQCFVSYVNWSVRTVNILCETVAEIYWVSKQTRLLQVIYLKNLIVERCH